MIRCVTRRLELERTASSKRKEEEEDGDREPAVSIHTGNCVSFLTLMMTLDHLRTNSCRCL